MPDVLFFRGSRKQAKAILRNVAGSLSGRVAGNEDLVTGIHNAVGFAAVTDISIDFETKSQGGVGVDGVKWKRLSPATLAYGRKAPKGRGKAPGGKDGLLSKSQLKQWRFIFATRLARFAASMPLGEAKGKAAAIAWVVIKKAGARTKLAAYANRPHEIGRDTGVMLNSLSPGELSGGSYAAPEDQKFERIAGGIIVGTNVPYAKQFDATRPIIPTEAPVSWIEGWLEIARQATSIAFRTALTRGAM